MKKFIAFGLLMVATVLTTAFASNGAVPGVELGAPESESISGGQCRFQTIHCFQGNNNCTIGDCNVAAQFGQFAGMPGAGNVFICHNGVTNNFCCGQNQVNCINQ